MPTSTYTPLRHAVHDTVQVRGLRYHVNRWGDPALATAARPPLWLLHGWMDVGASFQFVVDALAAVEGACRLVLAPDWRGFGRTESSAADCYWFPDYLADLDALLDAVSPGGPIDMVGHSMGGNIAMSYAGVRPQRVRRLVNLEGFGMPSPAAQQAPKRLLRWLDELKTAVELRPYDSLQAVAGRLLQNDPLLTPDKAAWLAPNWSHQRADGLWHILGDPAHKRLNPVPYRADEIVETWKQIQAPVLWMEGDRTDIAKWWGSAYTKADFEARLAVVPRVERMVLSPSGHMVHHDQPEALAQRLMRFLATD